MTSFFPLAASALLCLSAAVGAHAQTPDTPPDNVPAPAALSAPAPASPAPAPSRNVIIPAPPTACELRLGSWCIMEGAFIIQRKYANDELHERQWTLTNRLEPRTSLIVLEPKGCKQGLSDRLELMRLERNVKRDYRFWDKAVVRLKQDGRCDMTILMPVLTGDPRLWASSTGLTLVKGCRDDACSGKTLGELILAPAAIRVPRKKEGT